MGAQEVFRRAFERTLPGAGAAARWIDDVCQLKSIGGDVLFAMQVCLEELFSNIVRHGAPASSFPPQVLLTLEIDPERISLSVSDDGRPFDVANAPAQKISKPLAEVTPGGLGILLAKAYSETLTYERLGGLNVVRAEFKRPASDQRTQDDAGADPGHSAALSGAGIFQSVASAIPPVFWRPGDIPIRQGEASETAYYLTSGSVLVYAETSYGPVTLATCHAPRLIGEIGVLAGLPRTASIRVLTPSAVVPFSRETLLEIGAKEPGILVGVIGELGKQINGVNKAISLYTNALAALEKREFDDGILSDLKNPTPELEEFAAAFRRFADQIVHKRRQQDEMASAAVIQQSLLPDLALLQIPAGTGLHAAMRPARHVGGDFYDVLMLDNNRLAIVAGDVCGKGMPASLFMAVAVTVLRVVARQEHRLGAMLKLANAILCANNPSSMFATVLYGVLDLETGDFEYCNCGHQPPLLLRPSGELSSLPGGGLALAMMPDLPARVFSAKVRPGDALIFITNGVTEAMDGASEEFGEDRLGAALAGRNASAQDIVSSIFSAVDAFAGGTEQFDDITCVAVKFQG